MAGASIQVNDTAVRRIAPYVPSVIAITLFVLDVIACVLAHAYWAPIYSAWRARSAAYQYPPYVRAAAHVLIIVWLTLLPVAIITIIIGMMTANSPRVAGRAHVLANFVTVVGIVALVPGFALIFLALFKTL